MMIVNGKEGKEQKKQKKGSHEQSAEMEFHAVGGDCESDSLGLRKKRRNRRECWKEKF